jgi:predicted negative regulator of RcsB-dependent stress response
MSLTDQEQIQLFNSWWKSYGYYVVSIVLAVLLGIFGWRYWHGHSKNYLEQASIYYMQLLDNCEQQKIDDCEKMAQRLVSSYPSSVYASMASLMLAKHAVEAGDLKLAKERLRFVMEQASAKNLRQLARVRTARLLIEEKKYEDALKLLLQVDDKRYLADINEITADALYKLDRKEEAKVLYEKARELSRQNFVHSPLLEMKLQRF